MVGASKKVKLSSEVACVVNVNVIVSDDVSRVVRNELFLCLWGVQLCCICLGRYREGEMLRELPCHHHFHVSCVDTWLKINANCPLCKSEIEGGTAVGGEI